MNTILRKIASGWLKLRQALAGDEPNGNTAQRLLAYMWLGDGTQVEDWAAYGLIESLLQDEKARNEHATSTLGAC